MSESPEIKILIVDDCQEDREEWCRLLSSIPNKSYVFTEAGTAEEGLDILKSTLPDCLLLDYTLPDLTGVEFLKEMKTLFDGDIKIPVLMLTGQGDVVVATEVLKQGVQDYLIKDKLTDAALDRAVSNAIEKVSLKEKIDEKQRELQRFAFTVAHDLKSPLKRVSTYCDLLRKNCSEGVSDKTTQYMDIMQNDIQFVERLIDDLLEYAKNTSRSDKELVDVGLNDVLKRVQENLEINIRDASARVEGSDLPVVKGCEVSLVQLFQNIIANGIKFNESPTPTVKIEILSGENDQTCIAISDNGIGIKEKHLGSIFTPFKRLNSKSKYPGSGIGLATCKTIVEQHGGTIWAESEEGKGTIFYISLPKLQAQAA